MFVSLTAMGSAGGCTHSRQPKKHNSLKKNDINTIFNPIPFLSGVNYSIVFHIKEL
jgi:hypothetical protein